MTRENSFYTVRSAAPARSSRSYGKETIVSATGLVYKVRLRAWACDCAAFAFAAFGPGDYGPGSSSIMYGNEEDEGEDEDEEGEEVGGLSLNGRNGDGVPVCKHLLACLLAERCGDVFGRFVVESEVGREEGAGICGG